MIDRRSKNVEIFKDTCREIKCSQYLQDVINNSIENQTLFLEAEKNNYEIKNQKRDSRCQVVVSGKRSFEAAESYAKAGKKVAVLNFASATNPGGGVVNGSSAQEESLCRCSTLYQCLNTDFMWDKFYGPHRKADNPVYNDDILLTPDIIVLKSDTNFPEIVPENEWYKVDVITCAAPNLRRRPSNEMNPNAGSKAAKLTVRAYMEIMESRIEHIFKVAETTGADVLILGAFGCGAFRNPPEIVAELFGNAIEKHGDMFESIEFAVFHIDRESVNYEAFSNRFACS